MQRCETRGVLLYRFNSEDYPQRIGLHLDPARPLDAAFDLTDGDRVDIGRSRGIWLRRPQWPVIAPAVTDRLDQRLAVQESVAAAGGLWRLLAHLCVSPPDAMQAARWKLPQLARASRLGFPVPQTLVTTSAADAEQFTRAGPTVLKAIKDAYVRVGDKAAVGMTERVRLDQLEGVALAPVLLQREIAKVAEYRVTAVGRRIYAAKVVTASDAPVDVRALATADRHITSVTLDRSIESACRQYIQDTQLRYGAFDLAEDASGTIWFLECNPNGQWGWIEAATAMPITDAIVDLLLDPGGSERRA